MINAKFLRNPPVKDDSISYYARSFVINKKNS